MNDGGGRFTTGTRKRMLTLCSILHGDLVPSQINVTSTVSHSALSTGLIHIN